MTDNILPDEIFVLRASDLNSLQLSTLEKFLKMAKSAHMIDIHMRHNGQDHIFEADFLKHIQRSSPKTALDGKIAEALALIDKDGFEKIDPSLYGAIKTIITAVTTAQENKESLITAIQTITDLTNERVKLWQDIDALRFAEKCYFKDVCEKDKQISHLKSQVFAADEIQGSLVRALLWDEILKNMPAMWVQEAKKSLTNFRAAKEKI